METKPNLEVFLNPASVAVVGATERPGAWGSFIMGGLRSLNYPGKIYPVNRQADPGFGLKSYKDLRDVKGPVDPAVLAIPGEFVKETKRAEIAALCSPGLQPLRDLKTSRSFFPRLEPISLLSKNVPCTSAESLHLSRGRCPEIREKDTGDLGHQPAHPFPPLTEILKWYHRSPAVAAGVTDHVRTLRELMCYKTFINY